MLRTFKATTALATIFALGGCTAILGISSDPQIADAGAPSNTEAGADGAAGTCVGTLYVRIASDFSGTATDIAIPHFWGLYDYLRELNKNGGIRGCNIDIATSDNGYTAPKTIEVVQNWRTTDPNWANVSTLFIFGTGPTTGAGPQIMQEQKVIIPGSYAGAFASPAAVQKSITYNLVSDATYTEAPSSEAKASPGWPFIFYPATDYGTGIRLGIQAAWKLAPGRMAFAHDTPDKCAYCVEPLAAGKSFVENLPGMSIGRDLIIPQTSVDATTVSANTTKFIQDEILHFKAANAAAFTYEPISWIWSGNSVFASAIMGKTVAEQQAIIDKDPTIQNILTTAGKTWKIKVMANNWGIGETTPTICGPTCNGDFFYGLFPVPRFADLTNATAMAQLIATRDSWAQTDQQAIPPAPITARKYNDYRDVRYVQGYVAAFMWEEAVKKAVDAGSKNPTGAEIKNALEQFKAQDLGGLTAGPISFSPTDHRPQSNEVIYKVDASGNLAFVDRFSITLTNEWLGY